MMLTSFNKAENQRPMLEVGAQYTFTMYYKIPYREGDPYLQNRGLASCEATAREIGTIRRRMS